LYYLGDAKDIHTPVLYSREHGIENVPRLPSLMDGSLLPTKPCESHHAFRATTSAKPAYVLSSMAELIA
jgi:hypothetical protein